MRRFIVVLPLYYIAFFLPNLALAQTETPVIAMTAPQTGQALQGVITITGTSAVPGFLSSEIDFAYMDDATGTWFLIQAGDQPVTEGVLCTWDTTTLTDGAYTLRLRVVLADGSILETTVSDLRLRNYTPMETATPTITSTTPTSEPLVSTSTPTLVPSSPTPQPIPTHLPPNPAALTASDIYFSMGEGALAVVLLFVVFGLMIRFHRK